jgi:hypothetical protein
VLAAFKNPDEWINKDLRITSEFLSARQISEAINDVSGKTVHVQEVSPEMFQTFKGNPLPEELHAKYAIVVTLCPHNADERPLSILFIKALVSVSQAVFLAH